MPNIRIHIHLPSARQLGIDTLATVLNAADRVKQFVAPPAEEIPDEPAIETDVPETEEDLPEEDSPHRVTLEEMLTRAEAGIARTVEGASAFIDEVKCDVDAICDRDPAARSRGEVLCLYSGLHALMLYRASHALHEKGHYFPARLISQGAKFLTGIEIHPGATIGKGLFIDHGSGVVIGETAIVGDNCTLYQGVTLGGTGKDTGKRHPTLGNNVLVGAGAKLLGNFTIGDGAKIAAGAVVLRDVPENCTAVGIPARVVRRGGEKMPAEEMDQTHIPDPVSQQLARIEARLEKLEAAESDTDGSAETEVRI